MVRVAVLGLTHDHIWSNLRNLVSVPGAEVVAAAEPDAKLRERFASETGMPTHASYDALLDQAGSFDAVFCFADNRRSAELGARAASLGKHVLLEKPMASNLALADKLHAAARRHGVQLMINYPHN